MQENHRIALQETIDQGYQINIGQAISEGFRLYFRNIGPMLGFTLFYLLISFLIGLIPVVSTIFSLLISTPLSAGFFVIAMKASQNERLDFNHFFEGFNFFGRYIGYTLILVLIMLIIILPVFAISGLFSADIMQSITDGIPPELAGGQAAGFIIMFVILLLVYISWMFAIPFIQFTDSGAWEALENSRKLTWRQFGQIILLLLALIGINILGMIALVIGLLVTMPVTFIAITLIFKNLVIREEEEAIEHHLID